MSSRPQETTGSPPRPPSQQAPTAPDQFEDQGEGWQENRWNVWVIFLAQFFFFFWFLDGAWVFYFVVGYVRILFLFWVFINWRMKWIRTLNTVRFHIRRKLFYPTMGAIFGHVPGLRVVICEPPPRFCEYLNNQYSNKESDKRR